MVRDINDLFDENDVDEVEEVELDDVNVSSKGTSEDILEDYNFVRENLIRSIVRGSELIDVSIREAKTDPSARAIEAASGAVKTLTESSKGLLDLHEKIRNIDKEKSSDDKDKTEDRQIFKSTLSELIKQIESEEVSATN